MHIHFVIESPKSRPSFDWRTRPRERLLLFTNETTFRVFYKRWKSIDSQMTNKWWDMDLVREFIRQISSFRRDKWSHQLPDALNQQLYWLCSVLRKKIPFSLYANIQESSLIINVVWYIFLLLSWHGLTSIRFHKKAWSTLSPHCVLSVDQAYCES